MGQLRSPAPTFYWILIIPNAYAEMAGGLLEHTYQFEKLQPFSAGVGPVRSAPVFHYPTE